MKKQLIKIIIAFVLFLIALFMPINIIANVIFVTSYVLVGGKIVKKAIKNIFRGKVFDENFLMTIATLGAFAIGEFPEAVAVMLFYQVGELFQDYAVDKSRKSIESLMDIRPDYANIARNDEIEKVDPEEVKVGDIIVIKPGEKVPLDGIVIDGISMLDTVALTGESVPIEVTVGQEILSGSINQNGLLKVEVTKKYGESTVSKILELVENASSRKSQSEKFITKFAKYYTPIVVILAILIALVPPLLTNMAFSDWIYRALAFLVVSCPCALVISIPLSFFGGIGGASKMGILIKGSNCLEELSDVETVVFDKTGTLTEGVFDVQKIEAVNIAKEDLLRIVAHVENFSNHPISNSIRKVYVGEINEEKVENVKEIAGHGVFAVVEGKEVLVGNDKLMASYEINYTKTDEVGTVLYVAIEKEYAGYILISDKIKDGAKEAIEKLKGKNIKQVVMLTGDRENIAVDVASKLSIDKVHAELLPNEKVEKVEELMKDTNGKLIFVGDGINDAPVLALSDIGVAMGGLGADAAIEAADVVIMTDELSKISDAISLSKKTIKIVKENIVFAIGVKVAVLILTAIGIATMWEAVFADVGVSVIAILNALRVLKGK